MAEETKASVMMATPINTTQALESCRKNLEAAARKARAAREIGILDFWRLMRATDPDVWTRYNRRAKMSIGQAIAEQIVEEGISQGVFPENATVEGINWDGILAFLQGLLAMAPQIIAFIQAILALFGL